MSSQFLFPVSSDPTLHFTEALAAASSSLTPPFLSSAMSHLWGVPSSGSRRAFIRAIAYVAVQNIGLEFDFFGSASGLTGAVATEAFLGRYRFSSSDGSQINSAGLYQYYADGLSIPYFDLDTQSSLAPPRLHVIAQNVDTIAKLAGAAGAVGATFWVEPMQGF